MNRFMKNKWLWHGLMLFMLAGIFYTCKGDEEIVSPEEEFPKEVSEAKTWFESKAKDGTLLWNHSDGKNVLLTPNWKKAFSNENATNKVTEAPLNGAEQNTMNTSECMEKYQKTKDKRYLAWTIRLVIRTNKETKATDGFIMVAYPDLKYLEAHIDNPLKDFTFLKCPSDFGGMVIFYNMDGEFSNGWVYIEGAVYPLIMGN